MVLDYITHFQKPTCKSVKARIAGFFFKIFRFETSIKSIVIVLLNGGFFFFFFYIAKNLSAFFLLLNCKEKDAHI